LCDYYFVDVMKKPRIAINGFGRIGRTLAGLLLKDERLELVAINDLADVKTMAHLFKYDSIYLNMTPFMGFALLILQLKRIGLLLTINPFIILLKRTLMHCHGIN